MSLCWILKKRIGQASTPVGHQEAQIGSDSDIWQPWTHHFQLFVVLVSLPTFHDAVTAMLKNGNRSSSWFENAAFCCVFVVKWQSTLSSDSGLQNKLSVIWFFNFQFFSASGKLSFHFYFSFQSLCCHSATTGNSFLKDVTSIS